ncbi:MAG: BatA domain-containing protein [Pirellulales bacterium]
MTYFPLLLAFGFSNLWMLPWLAAAAAPILIYLWNKRRYRETSWAAMSFLMAAVRKNARRISIRNWLLMAMRMAIIALVVLAMAEPFVESVEVPVAAGQRTHRILVLDGSYSMAVRSGDSSRFERAKQLARQIVKESSQGDGFTLVMLADPPRVMVDVPVFDPGRYLAEIDALELRHGGGDLAATLDAAHQIAQQGRRQFPGLDRTEVIFFTDLGQTSWSLDAETRDKLGELGDDAALLVLDVGDATRENLAITTFAAVESFATVGQDVIFEAVVRNFGRQRRDETPVELWVDGSLVQESRIEVAAGGESSTTFAHRFDTPGSHRAEIRLADDPLAVDNHRWLVLPVQADLRVLCIGGSDESTRYLARALAPVDDARSPIQVEVASESGLLERPLEQFDCLFLSNVGRFTSSESQRLHRYLQEGGGLVFFLGDRVVAENYNRLLAADGDERVLPARLGEIVRGAQLPLDPLDYEHAIVQAFRDREEAGLLTTPVETYVRLQVPPQWEQAQTALAFASGDPVIVAEPRLRGRVVLVSTAASLASVDPESSEPWTAMPAWPSFLPVVRETLNWAGGWRAEQFNLLVGQSFGVAGSEPSTQSSVTVAAPGGQRHELRLGHGGNSSWRFDKTDRSGIYEIHSASSAESTRHFAVNVDTIESNLARIDPGKLPNNVTVLMEWHGREEASVAKLRQRSGLSSSLLYGAVALLLAESLVAWRLRRGAA